MYVLYVLYETIWNFTSVVMGTDYHDYIGKNSNKSENVRTQKQ